MVSTHNVDSWGSFIAYAVLVAVFYMWMYSAGSCITAIGHEQRHAVIKPGPLPPLSLRCATTSFAPFLQSRDPTMTLKMTSPRWSPPGLIWRSDIHTKCNTICLPLHNTPDSSHCTQPHLCTPCTLHTSPSPFTSHHLPSLHTSPSSPHHPSLPPPHTVGVCSVSEVSGIPRVQLICCKEAY